MLKDSSVLWWRLFLNMFIRTSAYWSDLKRSFNFPPHNHWLSSVIYMQVQWLCWKSPRNHPSAAYSSLLGRHSPHSIHHSLFSPLLTKPESALVPHPGLPSGWHVGLEHCKSTWDTNTWAQACDWMQKSDPLAHHDSMPIWCPNTLPRPEPKHVESLQTAVFSMSSQLWNLPAQHDRRTNVCFRSPQISRQI